MSTEAPAHRKTYIITNLYIDSRRKRGMDIVVALAGLLLFMPFWLATAVAILLEDRGTLLFRQRRLGRHRRPFDIRKIRTMQGNRITAVGRRLRRCGLDETAQFVNVLMGQMSLVGPRPLTKADVERLGWTGQHHERRFRAKPGITGVAQLFGGQSAKASYKMDLHYQKTATLGLDMKLVLMTLAVNLFGKQRIRRLVTRYRRLKRARFVARQTRRREARRRQLEAPSRLPAAPKPLPAEMQTAPVLKAPEKNAAVAQKLALLITPFYPKDPHSSFGKHVLTPSLALTSIAGATPEDWRVSYFDENLLQGPPPTDPVPQVVGITVHLTFADRAYTLADWYRKMGSKVVLGGLHVISCPEEAAAHADALAIGDGVELWPIILNDISEGTLKPIYDASFCNAYADQPLPDKQILPRKGFLTIASINATRGCKNRCRFCYMSTRGLRMPHRKRDVAQVVSEIQTSKEPYVVFTDNNLGSDRAYLRELCTAIEPLETIWSAAVSIDVTDDPRLIREMALAGCTGVFVGFESLSDANLAHARKKTPNAEDYARRVALFHANGIQVNASFVFGFDDDRPDVFAKTVEWIEANRLECATFHILTPYPGTPLFDEMNCSGRLLHRNWALYDTAHVVYHPKHMTPEELFNGYAWTYKRLFSHRSIWKRRPNDIRALIPYLAMAYLYKRANPLWRFLIKHNLVKTIWSPLIELTRRRHLKFRKRLAATPMPQVELGAARSIARRRGRTVLPAGL